MSDIDKDKVIEEYQQRLNEYNNLRDDVTNLQKSIADLKANIKNTQQMQDRMKQSNYEIWSQLENKDTQTKTTEEKEPTISDIIGSFKL